jgi:hypothetical protein
MPIAESPPHQSAQSEPSFFEAMHKAAAAASTWSSLSSLEREQIEISVCEAFLIRGIACMEEHPDLVLNGKTYHCFGVRFGSGAVLFLSPATKIETLVMVSLYVDRAVLRADHEAADQH